MNEIGKDTDSTENNRIGDNKMKLVISQEDNNDYCYAALAADEFCGVKIVRSTVFKETSLTSKVSAKMQCSVCVEYYVVNGIIKGGATAISGRYSSKWRAEIVARRFLDYITCPHLHDEDFHFPSDEELMLEE